MLAIFNKIHYGEDKFKYKNWEAITMTTKGYKTTACYCKNDKKEYFYTTFPICTKKKMFEEICKEIDAYEEDKKVIYVDFGK